MESEEKKQFDSLLGGDHSLPNDINIFKYAAARAQEIEFLENSLQNPTSTKLIFQKLPIHMRRRVMSHNTKRLPRRLRKGHLNQLIKSGLPPKQKRPSRKYRRRPVNLQKEYLRRQTRICWLETHLWHAKRFHMIERWGYKIPDKPCDKSFRALYRASAQHCLIQDISYYNCIEISGMQNSILDIFSEMTSPKTGLSIGAKCYINGQKEGTIMLYYPNSYPNQSIGEATFFWKPNLNQNDFRTLWIWIHPGYSNEVLEVLKSKTNKNESKIEINNLRKDINRFRLTGPLSHIVLKKCFEIANKNNISKNNWFENHLNSNIEQSEFWNDLNVSSPAELPPRIIIGLTVCDPRFNIPKKRTKAVANDDDEYELAFIPSLPSNLSFSHIWDPAIRKQSLEDQLSNTQICNLKSRQLVPGEQDSIFKKVATLPILIIQRPGNQTTNLGYGSGYDIILPTGWGLPLWRTLIMWGARAGGLREDRVSIIENFKGVHFPPDTNAGQNENNRIKNSLVEKYFKLPPSKRVNYTKFGIVSPFLYKWNMLAKEWLENPVGDNFYVLRDVQLLSKIQNYLETNRLEMKGKLEIDCTQEAVLVPVKIQLKHRGLVQRFAIICLPNANDTTSKNSENILEKVHVDVNEIKRKQLRNEHKTLLKRLKRKRTAIKRKCREENTTPNIQQNTSQIIEDQCKKMRELWIPEATTIRHSCDREVIGYITHGDFSFNRAKSCAVGFITLQSVAFIKNKTIFVRNTSNRCYRLANIDIII